MRCALATRAYAFFWFLLPFFLRAAARWRRLTRFADRLPREIEFYEQLRLHVARNVGKPRVLRTQPRQLIDLIKRGGLAPIDVTPGRCVIALRVGGVPEESLLALPVVEQRDLLRRGVAAIFEPAVNEHGNRTVHDSRTERNTKG